MDDGVILKTYPRPQGYGAKVPPDYRPRAYETAFSDSDIANDNGIGMNKSGRGNPWRFPIKLIDRHNSYLYFQTVIGQMYIHSRRTAIYIQIVTGIIQVLIQFGVISVDVNAITRDIGRGKKRETLNMIPMQV